MTKKRKIMVNAGLITILDILILASGIEMYLNGSVDPLNLTLALASFGVGLSLVFKTREMIMEGF